MAYHARIEKTGTGSAMNIDLTFPYLDQNHVIVTEDGIAVSYTWNTSTQIRLASTTSGSEIIVYRDTNDDSREVVWTSSQNPVTPEAMNTSDLQWFYRLQELHDLQQLPGAGGGSSTLDGLTDTAIGTPSKGELLAHNGTAWVDFPVGTDNQILRADSAEPLGVVWGDANLLEEAEIAALGFLRGDEQETVSAPWTFSGSTHIYDWIGDGVSRYVQFRGDAGTIRGLLYQTGATSRWVVAAESSAESGGDVGSDFAIFHYSDAGVYKGNPFRIERDTGIVKLGYGLTVTGDITPTGTVDGRDVATDGTKLDGIESGATADQTASEILSLLQTVDGAGSGLDADLLDGNHASAFALSGHTHAAADITSGTFADARIAQSNVTQHQSALTIAESQITDGSILARLAANETITGNWTFSGSTNVYDWIGDGGNRYVEFRGDAGTHRGLLYRTGTTPRWVVSTENSAESGGDVGSDFGIFHYSDAGALKGNPFRIERDTGIVWVGYGLTVTGNILPTGTVDGRDVAADGTKLDGIEAGATADQTASEILSLLQTVDGAGSGLDADLLDGNHASAFATAGHNHTLDSLSDTLMVSKASGDLLRWNGTNWHNRQVTFDDLADGSVTGAVKGSIIVRDGSSTWQDLSVGTNDHVLTADSTAPFGVAWKTLPAGVTDHGALTGLADNDHPQYARKASSETITGDWSFEPSGGYFTIDNLAASDNGNGVRIYGSAKKTYFQFLDSAGSFWDSTSVFYFDRATAKFVFNKTAQSPQGFEAGNGSAGGPSFSFSGDTNTGMYLKGTDNLAFATAGVEAFDISSTRIVDFNNQPTVNGGPVAQSGQILQESIDIITATSTSTTGIPVDGTVPQSSEGVQWTTKSFTPKKSDSTIVVEAEVKVSHSKTSALSVTLALFKDSGTSAVAASSATCTNNGHMQTIVLRWTETSGSTSARTYKFRFGTTNDVNASYINRWGTVSNPFGTGNLPSSIKITEIAA